MTAEERLAILKQLPRLTSEERKRRAITAVVLALNTLLSLIFLGYALYVKSISERQLKESRQQIQQLQKENDRLRELAR